MESLRVGCLCCGQKGGTHTHSLHRLISGFEVCFEPLAWPFYVSYSGHVIIIKAGFLISNINLETMNKHLQTDPNIAEKARLP